MSLIPVALRSLIDEVVSRVGRYLLGMGRARRRRRPGSPGSRAKRPGG